VLVTLLLTFACAQDRAGDPPWLGTEKIGDAIAEGDPSIHTPALDSPNYARSGQAIGKSYRIQVNESGLYWVELSSCFFDAYLVLREESGVLLAEDDDGLISTHARVALALDAGKVYVAEACALHGGRGKFELSLHAGSPPVLSPQGRGRAAREEAERCAEVVEAELGAEHPVTARSLDQLGFLLAAEGDHDAARSAYERALAIREASLGPEHPDTAMTLDGLGRVLEALGDLEAARSCTERALMIFESVFGAEHADTAIALDNLALILRAQGDYAGARAHAERSLAIFEKVFGPEHIDVAKTLNNLCGLLQEQGDFESAQPYLERSLAIREKLLGPEHPSTATALNNLGALLRAKGEFGAARASLERALAIFEKVLSPGHPATAAALDNLAQVLFEQGDFEAALPYAQRSVEIRERSLGPDHPDHSRSLNTLAFVLKHMGQLDGARPHFERSLAILERALGPWHPETATALNNLAGLLASLGDDEQARSLYVRALAIDEKAVGPDHPKTVTSLANLAALLDEQGDYRRALPHLQRALAIMEEVFGPESPKTTRLSNNVAVVLTNLHETRQAWDLASRARARASEHLQATLFSLSEAEGYRYLAQDRWHLDLLLSLARILADPVVTREAYQALLAWKGHVGRLLATSRQQLLRAAAPEARDLVAAMRSCQSKLSTLAFRTEIQDQKQHDEQLAQLRMERNRLELALQRTLQGTATGERSFDALRRSLPDHSACLDFLVCRPYRPARLEGDKVVEPGSWEEARLSVWITRPDREQPVQLDLGPASELDSAIRRFIEEIAVKVGAEPRGIGVSADVPPRTSGTTVRAALWDPVAEHLDGVTLVFVSPDSFLGTLPFEVLQLADGTFLIERFSFVYWNDLSVIAVQEKEEPSRLDTLLAMGGVDFGSRAELDALGAGSSESADEKRSSLRKDLSSSWASLPHTRQESELVVRLHRAAFPDLGSHLLLQGAEPTEERLGRELARCSVAHLATHGFFHPDGLPSLWEALRVEVSEGNHEIGAERRLLAGYHPGLLSGLVCAGANAEPEAGREDGYLTAEEVGWLDLSGLELVVLSACETGLGRAQSGEGLLGLRRAFEVAGARTVISSLWAVKDDSTARLMQDFYENLWGQRSSRGHALRAAQLAALARNRAEHGDPLPATWGAFVLSGEWR
jgi:CHAT domain-containing protein/tetratricopeptide (TPR) repeat protein